MKLKLIESLQPRLENDTNDTPIWIRLGDYDSADPLVEFDRDRYDGPYVSATVNLPGYNVLKCFDLPKNVLDIIDDEGKLYDWSVDASDEFKAYGPDEDDPRCVLRTDDEEEVAKRILADTVVPVLCGLLGYGYYPWGNGGWPKQVPDIVWDHLATDPKAQKRLAEYNCTLDDLHEYVRQAHDPATIKKLAKLLEYYDYETDEE